MARQTDVLQVVTLARMKMELRIDAGGTDHDTLIEAQIAGAASWVSTHLGQPVVEEESTYPAVPVPSDHDAPIVLPVWEGATVQRIAYWSTAGALRLEADGELLPAALGRTSEHQRRTAIWPPAAGWPAVLPGSAFAVTVLRGLDLEAHRWRGIEQAIILLCRQLYQGYPMMRGDNATYALLRPFRRLL